MSGIIHDEGSRSLLLLDDFALPRDRYCPRGELSLVVDIPTSPS